MITPRIIRELGPLTVTRLEGPQAATSYQLVLLVPFTQTRVSVQLQLLVFDEP